MDSRWGLSVRQLCLVLVSTITLVSIVGDPRLKSTEMRISVQGLSGTVVFWWSTTSFWPLSNLTKLARPGSLIDAIRGVLWRNRKLGIRSVPVSSTNAADVAYCYVACRFAGPKLSEQASFLKFQSHARVFVSISQMVCQDLSPSLHVSSRSHSKQGAGSPASLSSPLPVSSERRIKMLVSGKVSGHPNLLGSMIIFGKVYPDFISTTCLGRQIIHVGCFILTVWIYPTVTLTTVAWPRWWFCLLKISICIDLALKNKRQGCLVVLLMLTRIIRLICFTLLAQTTRKTSFARSTQ